MYIKEKIGLHSITLAYCKAVNNDCQRSSGVLYTFVPNKSFGQLLDFLPKNFLVLKVFNSGFWYIEVWFTDQNYKQLEGEDRINITLVTN